MGEKLFKLVDNHLNAGARINHDRRQLAKVTKSKLKKVKMPKGSNIVGNDGGKMGAE
jgi:hypothetical protein